MDFTANFNALMKSSKVSTHILALKCITLFVIKTNAPKLWDAKGFVEHWQSTFLEILPRVPQMIGSLTEVEDRLDFWYFTKLEGRGDICKPDMTIIRAFMMKPWIVQNKSPKKALLFYVFIRTLQFCAPKEVEHLQDCVGLLETICRPNLVAYGYFLTHVILYDLQFGKQKTLLSSTKVALQNLNVYCETKLEDLPIDLIGEILVCTQLCPSFPFSVCNRLLKIIEKAKPQNEHERAVFACVACPFE